MTESGKLAAGLVAAAECLSDTQSKLRQRTQGRLDRSRDPAILDAALAALAENGYNDTNMNDTPRERVLVKRRYTAAGRRRPR